MRSAVVPLLLTAWSALIVYASWFPWTGWRWPPGLQGLGLLALPWPRGHSPFDVVANLLGYVPLGMLLVPVLGRRQRPLWHALRDATLAAATLSYALEVGQYLLPQRVP